MVIFGNRSKTLEIHMVFHLRDLFLRLPHLSETLGIHMIFLLSRQIQNWTFGGIPEMLVFKNKYFLGIVQNHWEFKHFPVPETLVILIHLIDFQESACF